MTATITQGSKFSEAFWDDHHKGIEIVSSKMRKSRETCEEIKKLYELRASIEQDYGERLLKLAQNSKIGEFEENSFAETLSRIPSIMETTARAHIDLAEQLKDHLEAPLDGFLKEQREIRKLQQQQIESTKQLKCLHQSDVSRAREVYAIECQKLIALDEQSEDTPSEEKLREIEEQKRMVTVADQVYRRSVDNYNAINDKFVNDWTASANKFQEMEVKRITYLRSTLWSFANMMTSTFSIDEECCDRLRTALEITDVDKDMNSFVNKYRTGSNIPQPIAYEVLYDPALLVQTTPSTSIHSLMDKKHRDLQNQHYQDTLKQKIEHTEQAEQPRMLQADGPTDERIIPLNRSTGSNLTNPDEELKSIDHQLQKIEIQSIPPSEIMPDQLPHSAQSNNKAFKEVEQMLSNQAQDKSMVEQPTSPTVINTAYTQDTQPLLGEFSSGIYNALGMKEGESHYDHVRPQDRQHNDYVPLSPNAAHETNGMMDPMHKGNTNTKYKPVPNPVYQTDTDQHDEMSPQALSSVSPRSSSLHHREKKSQPDTSDRMPRENGHYNVDDSKQSEEDNYQNRIPKPPTKDEKWVISSIRRPQQLPVKTQNATMYDGSVRSSSILSASASPIPHKQLDEVEIKHQPKLHKPTVPLTIEIPNAVKSPADMAQHVIQEGRRQIQMSPVVQPEQFHHVQQEQPQQQPQNGISEDNGMGIRPAPWQEEFKSNDHIIKNAGYRGPPMMATNTNAAMPATAYYTYQQPARASVFRQDPHSFEPHQLHDEGAQNKKRFGVKSQPPSGNKQSEAPLKSAASNLKDKEKEKGRFSLGFFGGNKKEKKKEKEAAANAAVIANYQQQQTRPVSQAIYAESHESFDSSNLTKQSNGRYPMEAQFICYAKAQWPFEATIEGEMSFNQDEVLGVIRKQADGWWEAERIGPINTGQRGLIPGNYMQDYYPPPPSN
ncbi:hypothetical protein BD560DRAFT_448712 [Blakeslea trispora]|nr:hypothetical protein BD560DRAFT_448712 [Blakeslea trispora]